MPNHTLTIDLNGLGLTDKQLEGVQQAVRSAALSEIAKLQPGGTKPGGLASGFHFPNNPGLIGLWIRNLNDKAIKELGLPQ